jgi:hypothetical protein
VLEQTDRLTPLLGEHQVRRSTAWADLVRIPISLADARGDADANAAALERAFSSRVSNRWTMAMASGSPLVAGCCDQLVPPDAPAIVPTPLGVMSGVATITTSCWAKRVHLARLAVS